jgi:hypothetical protein
MLLQPGQGMGLLGAYNTGYTPINPQMNHYNSLLGRIGGMTFTQPSGAMGPVANYFEGNTLMSGATGQPVYNLPAGAGQQYGTTQSYMDTLGRMPTSSNEIISPYIYYRPQTDLSKIQQALEDQKATPEEVAQTDVQSDGRNDYVDPYATSKATAQNRRNDGGQGDKLRDAFRNRKGTGGYSDMGSGQAGGTQAGNGLA